MAAANPYGLVAVRSRRLRYWWAGLGVLVLLAVYASPMALALRVPSLAGATVPAPLPALTLPSIGAPLLRVPTVHPLAPLPVVRPPVAHAVVVPVEAAPVVHHAMRVVRDVHSQVVATLRSSSGGAAADPFARAPIVQDDVGAVATIPAAEVSQSEAVQYSFFSTSDPPSTATSSNSPAATTTTPTTSTAATTAATDTTAATAETTTASTTTTTPTDTTATTPDATTSTTDTTATTTATTATTTATATTAATDGSDAATATPATPWNVTLTDPTSHAISLGTVSGDLQIAVNGNVVGSQAPDAVSSISIVGVPVFDDTLTVDLSSGPILAPISFDGGAGGYDTLVVTGSTGSFTSTATGPQSGTVTAGPTTITYSNLEPVAGGDSTDATLTTTGADDAATLTATAAKATLQVTSGTAESTTLDDPTRSLTVDVGAGDDDLTIGDISGYTGALTVDGGAGTDTLTISSSEAIGYDGSTLTLGSRPITVESFEYLDVTGDGTNAVTISTDDDVTVGGGEISFGGQTVSVSQVSGVAVEGAAPGQTFAVAGVDTPSIPQLRLAGSGGGDTYAMGDGFGSVHVDGSPSDTLDFSRLSRALSFDATTYSDTGDAADVLTVSSAGPGTVVWPSVDDHWQQVDAPNPDLSSDVLRGVSCLSDTDCVAVGSAGTGALAAEFDGAGWTDLGAVDAANEQESVLYSVSCPSATFCVAAGLSGEINDQYTTSLVETWDGSQWQQATLPGDPGEYAHLDGVSCSSASDCMAVGDYYNQSSNGYAPYSLHWDGSAWSPESMSITGINYTIPDGVSCAGGACMAVGSGDSPGSSAETVYVEEWDGTSWSLGSGAANPGTTNNSLGAVSCLSATSCVAAGEMDSYYGSGGDNGTMVQTWDGTTWSLVEDTSAAAQGIGISSIACATAADCTLVGGDSSSGATTFAEEFDGSSLSVDSTPSPAGTARGDQNTLDGVSCATVCLAVGGYSWAGSPGRALALTTAAGPFAPGIDLLDPSDGALAGGTAVTIRGAGFDGATAVEFGSIAATSYTVVSDDEIDAVAPDCGCSGTTAAGVSVTTPVAASATGHASDVFTYLGQPVVTGVSPSSGVAGRRVVVTGTGFTGATEVDFGTTSASFVVESDTTIDATAPAGSGVVDVVVSAPGGVSATSAADEFTIVPPPSVTGVTPSSGPSTGGTTIEIYGSGFTGASSVELDLDDYGQMATFTVVSDTEISATTPAFGYTGDADVVVTGPGGTSATSSGDIFVYEPPQFTVTTTADSDDAACTATLCSLRDAVDASNGAGAGDVTVPAGDYVLTGGPLYITAGIAITGAGARETIVDGNDAEQVIRGDRSNAPSISLTDLTITGGHSQATDAPDYNEGGGIISWGPLTLTRVAVVGNTAYADGGGMAVVNDLTVVDSTIADNTAGGDGGGIRAQSGFLSISNSTIADNTAQTRAALAQSGDGSIQGSTIAGNTNTLSMLGSVFVSGGTLTLEDDVIANDVGSGLTNCYGAFASDGYNLDTDGSCELTATGDQSDAAGAGLGPLADNGGETDTMLPQTGSPLIDAGGLDCTGAPTDQRGDARPQGAACDIGAVEVQPGEEGANDFLVTTPADSEDGACTATLCSLRDAVEASNGADGGDVTVPSGHYVLTQGPLYVTADISIAGASARETIVDGDGAEQVIRGDRTNAPSISLTDLTITGGHSLATDAPDYNEGGGIISWGPLTLTRVAVVGNTAYADGGGLFVIGDLTIADSTIADNTAGGTNGAFEDEHGSVSVVDSTIADNTSYSGAVGLSDPTAASIVSSTIAGNSSTAMGFTPSAIAVGGGADLTLQDDVIANDLSNGQQNCESGDPIDSNGYNLDTDGSCGLTATGDQSDAADAGLGALADNGGETDTMLPLAGSSLIDGGGSSCTSTDQRGDARPQGAACDIGAVETAPAAANEPPTASFTSSASGLEVSLDGSGSSDPDGTVVGWAWDFGDGLTGQGETVSHTYATAGTYTVTLVVTDDGGATASSAQQVTVAANQPPVASFTSSANGLLVSFDGSGSSDPDGTVASWTWDFGDGLTGQGETASHTYAADGAYTVTLVVRDDGGATGSVAHDVTVANAPPAAAFTSSSSTLTAFVDASGSSDPDGTIVSYAWSFGDGSTGSGVTAAHLYRAAGTYAVELTVTDNDGATASVTHDVSVQPPVFAYQPVKEVPPPDFPPRASFTVTTLDQSGAVIVRPGIAASGNEATTFAVDGSGSTDDHGIVAYTWSFGDGAVASGMKASHVYGAPGTYTVTLTVRDTSGRTDGTSESVAVTNAPPQASFTYGVARALMRTRGSAANPSRTIAFASTSWDDGRIVSYAWTFGDGHRATGPYPTHVYAGTKAHFTVTLVVTDNDGATDTVRERIDVAVPPPNVVDDESIAIADGESTPPPASVTDIEQITTADGEATPQPASVTDVEQIATGDGETTPQPTSVTDVEQITTGDGGTPGNAPAPARTRTRPKEKKP